MMLCQLIMMEGEVFGHSSGFGYVLWGVIILVFVDE
jgi:hypothetical protein